MVEPEYIGGGSFPVNITPIANTSDTATAKQGDLAGVGTAGGQIAFKKSFTEYGYVVGFLSFRSDLTYSQGQDRHWNRSTRYDYFWPALQNISEQAVLNKEIYWDDATPANNDLVFGCSAIVTGKQ